MVAAPTGILPLRALQLGIEGTRGVSTAATLVLPALGVDLNPQYPTSRRPEQRGTFVKLYRPPIVTQHMVSIGVELVPTFEEAGLIYAMALKGGITVATSAATVKTRTYTPTASTDDLKTATIEVVTDTQNYTIPFCVVQRVAFGWELGSPATMQVDFIGQRLTSASKTAALSAISSEEMNPASALAWIDTTTIGTTAALNVQSFQWTVDNGQVPLLAPDGNNYPANFYRGEQRSMTASMVANFDSTTEFAAFQATTARKIRTQIVGSVISGSTGSVTKKHTTDWYGYWDEAPFNVGDGITQCRFSGESVYDTGVSYDWSVSTATGLAAQAGWGES